jgi:hypothetical protein
VSRPVAHGSLTLQGAGLGQNCPTIGMVGFSRTPPIPLPPRMSPSTRRPRVVNAVFRKQATVQLQEVTGKRSRVSRKVKVRVS